MNIVNGRSAGAPASVDILESKGAQVRDYLQIYIFIEWTVSHNVGLIGLVLVHSSTRKRKL